MEINFPVEINLPAYVENIINKLESKGFSAYIVGGCVRDIIIGREPSDYDIATNALPEEILEIFGEYRTIEVGKKFGTIAVVQYGGIVEVTTFRTDGEYLDGRRPEEVCFSKDLKEDLSRRDFTINAIAYNKNTGLIDYFNGIRDIDERIIKTVGNPEKRFKEDYLRMLRGVRFATELGFDMEEDTYKASKENIENLGNISKERIREELFKILLSKEPSYGMKLLKDLNIIPIILPELEKSIDFHQHNPHHNKDVFNHTLCVLDNVPPILHLRLAALFHDIGKPYTFTLDEEGIGHFYGHDKIGAKMAREILNRLKSSKDLIGKVSILIETHMTHHDGFGEKGLKRLLAKVGEEEIFTLLELQKADRLCSSKDENIDDLLIREERIKNILEEREVYEENQLAIDGNDVIELGYAQGKIIGEILAYLLEEVLENPKLNKKEILIEMIKEKF